MLQVFDVVLNREHIVVEGLDIFGKVGRGIAHDEIIPFSVKSSKLRVGGESSFLDGKLPIDFVKVNALSFVVAQTVEHHDTKCKDNDSRAANVWAFFVSIDYSQKRKCMYAAIFISCNLSYNN